MKSKLLDGALGCYFSMGRMQSSLIRCATSWVRFRPVPLKNPVFGDRRSAGPVAGTSIQA